VAALDSREDPPAVPAWRPPARRRAAVLALTLAALGVAVAVVVTGPPRPVLYDARLPLLVFGCGAALNAAQWRRAVTITRHEVAVRTLLRTRRVPLPVLGRVVTGGGRVTVHALDGRKVVARVAGDPSAAGDLARAIVTAAGPAAYGAAGPPPAPVPMATPWLIMLSTAGIALLTAKGFATHPVLVTALLGTGTVTCCTMLGSSWLHERRERVSEPRGWKAAEPAR